jgi:hypothetical protein
LGKRVRFHQNLRAAGRAPAREILAVETRNAAPTEAEALHLAPGAPVHVCDGLTLADGMPLSLFQSLFPADRFPSLPEALRRHRSITAALAECGLADYTRASTRLTAKLATPSQARHLQIAPCAPRRSTWMGMACRSNTVARGLPESGSPSPSTRNNHGGVTCPLQNRPIRRTLPVPIPSAF